jgi:phosphotransferase system IIB component
MNNDKTKATFHPGAAPVSWTNAPAPEDVPDPAIGTERPWASPGTPLWAGQMTERPRRKGLPGWAWVGIVVALVTLFCGGMVVAFANGGEEKDAFSETFVSDPPSASEGPAVVRLGKTFRSGNFQYTIHNVKTGLNGVGDDYNVRKAQGSYTRLEITVKNVGQIPAYFDSDSRIKVEDATGSRFSADTTAAIYGNPDEDGWFTEINPGNAIKAYAFFDLPKGVIADRAVVSPGMLTFEADAVVPLR